LLED
jgi:hypothetical protein